MLKRDFHADKPFEKLTTDVTEFKIGDEKVYLSPVLDMFNREIVSYSISTSPNLWQIREMLDGLFEKLPPMQGYFHSDQGWQYQHAEYQRLLAEHNITQSMSRKGNCMDNGIMENFFGRIANTNIQIVTGLLTANLIILFISELLPLHSLLMSRNLSPPSYRSLSALPESGCFCRLPARS